MKSGINLFRPHRTLLMAALLAVSCCALRAQSDGPPPGQMRQHGGQNPERQLEMLTQRLSLTTDQQTQVKSLLADQRQKMEELRKSADPSAPPNREQMEAIRNDTDTKITALLNDDQKPKYAALLAERKARMERRGGDGPPPPPPPGE